MKGLSKPPVFAAQQSALGKAELCPMPELPLQIQLGGSRGSSAGLSSLEESPTAIVAIAAAVCSIGTFCSARDEKSVMREKCLQIMQLLTPTPKKGKYL